MKDCIDLSSGDTMYAELPACVQRALRIESRKSRNVPVTGDLALKTLFADEFARLTAFRPPEEQMVVTAGGSRNALSTAFSFARRSSMANYLLLFVPSWSKFLKLPDYDCLGVLGIKTTQKKRFIPSPADLKSACKAEQNIAAVLINYYTNPSGASWSESHARKLGEAILSLPKHVILIEDCLYWQSELEPRGKFPLIAQIVPELWQQGRAIGVASLTKGWAMHGNHALGFAWGPPEYVKWATSVIRGLDLDADSTLQIAARQAFSAEGMLTPVELRKSLRANLDAVKALCAKTKFRLALEPHGGTNALLDASQIIGHRFRGTTIDDEGDLVRFLSQSNNVAVASGSEFCCEPGHFRIHLGGAEPASFKLAMERLSQFSSNCS